MSYRRSLGSVLTLILALSFASIAMAAEKAPKLTLVDPVKDFGTVPKGEKLEFNFTIKNNGTADLQILNAAPACGCTVADFDKVIKPGQTGKVHAVVETINFSGPIAKSVTLQTNDPNTPSAQVTIQANVKPYVEAHPAGFLRYTLLQGDAQTQTVTLYSEDEAPFQITGVEVPGDYVKVKYAKIEKDSDRIPVGRAGQAQYRIDVTLGGPDAPVGPLSERLLIRTNSKYQPEYNLSLTGVVRATYSVQPSLVNFGEIAPTDEAAQRVVVVQSNNRENAAAFKVQKVESSVAGVKAQAKPSETPGVYEVSLNLDKAAKKGDFEGMVKITTTDTVKPVIEIPVRGTVK